MLKEPGDDQAIRGGKEVEIRGRGGREAFTVDDGEGSGKILAVRSSQPFQLDAFTRSGHWNYSVLTPGDSVNDVEAALLALADRMVGGRYDYDLVTYTVTTHPPLRRSMGWGWGWGGRGWP